MFESFLGRIGRTRVRVWKRTARERRRKRSSVRKCQDPDLVPFYLAGGTGRFWPGPPPSWVSHWILSMERPDRSNAPKASRMIRIHLWHGFGPVVVGLGVFFMFSLFFCYVHLLFLLSELPICPHLFTKIPKKILMRSWYICDCFVIFYMWKLIKIWQVLISHLIGIFCVFYKFSRMFAYPNSCPMILMVSTWFHGNSPLFS